MASTRTIRTSPSDAKPAIAEALTAIARESARIQIGALSATAHAVVDWAHAAERLARAVGDELLRRVDGESDSRQLIVGVASATAVHVHELAALPSAAANHFDARITRAPINA